MKLESVSEDQNSYTKHNGNGEHANGATDDEKAILVSKEAITTKTLGKKNKAYIIIHMIEFLF